jgi:NAD dependent epimerase/dehydratase family enzyme
MQASTATIYAHRFDSANDEKTGIIGGQEENVPDTWKFSIDVATNWERRVDDFELPKTRKLKLRSAIILSPDRGGIFDELLKLVRYGLGGKAGDGRQFVSWVHYKDFVRAVDWLIAHEEISGVVNIASPNPLPKQAFIKALRQGWGIPFGLSATEWMLEVGALLMQTETELILKSRRVVPGLLLEKGFSFQFPSWPEAAESLCAEWRAAK